MKNWIIALTVILTSPSILAAQSHESASGSGSSLWAGAEFSVFNPDYYCTTSSPFSCGGNGALMKGIATNVDYNSSPRWGVLAEARWLRWSGLGGQVESSCMAGGRYAFYRRGKFKVWAKLTAGGGWITTANYPGPQTFSGSLFVYAPGATLNYRLNRRFAVVGDYELQRWTGFAVSLTHNHALTPNGVSVGISYKILGR